MPIYADICQFWAQVKHNLDIGFGARIQGPDLEQTNNEIKIYYYNHDDFVWI